MASNTDHANLLRGTYPFAGVCTAHPSDKNLKKVIGVRDDPGRRDLVFEEGAFGLLFAQARHDPPVCSVAPNTDNTAQLQRTLTVVWFGKTHDLTCATFIDTAAKIHSFHHREAALLLQSLHAGKAIYDEWADPDGWIDSLVAGSVRATSGVVEFLGRVKTAPKPDPAEFDTLMQRVNDEIQRLKEKNLEYEAVRDMGLALHRIRSDEKRLNQRIASFRDGQITAAGDALQGAELIESTSFSILGLVPTLTLMDPIREAAYRISLLIVRAGARSVGALAADSSVWTQIWSVLKADAPPIIVDLITKPLGPLVKGYGKFWEEACTHFIQQIIELMSDLFILVIECEQKNKQPTAEDLRDIFINRLTASFSKVLSVFLGGASETMVKTHVKALCESTANTVWRDLIAAAKVAEKDPNRSTADVFLGDIGWTLVKIVQGTLVGGMNRNAGRLAETQQTRGRTSMSRDEGIEYLRGQRVSSVFTGKTTATGRPPATPPPIPRPGDGRAYVRWIVERSETAQVHPDTIGPLIRYANENNVIIAFRIPSQHMMDLQAEFGIRPKPGPVKANTARKGGFVGRVAKPSEHTHDAGPDLDRAVKNWTSGRADLEAHGDIVLETGLVVHPGMLRDLVPHVPAEHHEILNDAATAYEKIAGTPHFDLTLVESRIKLEKHFNAARQEEVSRVLATYRVGYGSDLDLAEVLDANTGERILMGAGNESGAALEFVQGNRDALDSKINVNHPGVLLNPARPDHYTQYLIQHGGDHEYFKGAVGGQLGVLFPDGTVTRVGESSDDNATIHEKYETEIRSVLQDNYVAPEARTSRGAQLVKDLPDEPLKASNASGNLTNLAQTRTDAAWYGGNTSPSTVDRSSLPIINRENDLLASMTGRDLAWDPSIVGETLGLEPESLEEEMRRHDTLVAVNEGGTEVIVAIDDVTAATATVPDAIAALARTAAALGLRTGARRVHYEYYTGLRPTTRGGIADRVGGPLEPGDLASLTDIGPLVPAFRTRDDADVIAFAQSLELDADTDPAVRTVEMFTPGHDPSGIATSHPLRTSGMVAVWKPRGRHEIPCQDLITEPLEIDGEPVGMLSSPIYHCPNSVDVPQPRWAERQYLARMERDTKSVA